MQLVLKGKTAIITGVSRKKGIGSAIAKAFAAQGANLFLIAWPNYDKTMPWGYSENELQETIDEIRSHNVLCETLEIDLSDSASANIIFEKAKTIFGSIEVLVNNAVVDIDGDIFSITEKNLQQHFSVNIIANVFLCAEFLRHFQSSRGGRIINLTSGQGLAPMPRNLNYAMSKGAIEALTLSLSTTAGEKGITVNAIDPGPTDTGWMSESLLMNLAAQSPFGRVGLPTDVANLAVFLASDASTWITGQVLRSRGGL